MQPANNRLDIHLEKTAPKLFHSFVLNKMAGYPCVRASCEPAMYELTGQIFLKLFKAWIFMADVRVGTCGKSVVLMYKGKNVSWANFP